MRIRVFGILLLLLPVFLFAQEADAGETEEAAVAVEITEDAEGEPEVAAAEETGETAPTVEVADPEDEPDEEEIVRVFEGEKTLKGVKVYENRIYSDALRGIFGNYIASWVIAGDIKKGLGKTVTHEAVVAHMEELRAKDEIESIDFYYTFDAKDRVIIHVILIDNPGFREFEGTVTLDRIDFYCRNNFFVSRRVLNDAVSLDKKGTYTEEEIKAFLTIFPGGCGKRRKTKTVIPFMRCKSFSQNTAEARKSEARNLSFPIFSFWVTGIRRSGFIPGNWILKSAIRSMSISWMPPRSV